MRPDHAGGWLLGRAESPGVSLNGMRGRGDGEGVR
jgi:hypothetical protein